MARTPKARALGGALRQARESKGLLLRELASAIDRDMGVLSRWETGDRTPKPEQVARVLTQLGVHGERFDDIMALAYGTDESQWVATTLPERRQQMAAYVDWERSATAIVEVAPLLVPGLLQIGDYVRAIMTAGGVPADEVDSRIADRIERQEIITGPDAPQLSVLLGQNVLNADIGGRAVSIAQARHLIELAARPNVDLRIIPDHCGWHPGLEGHFALIDARRPGRKQISDTIAFVETRQSVLMLHDSEIVEAYRHAVDRIATKTLDPDASVRFLADMAGRLERT